MTKLTANQKKFLRDLYYTTKKPGSFGSAKTLHRIANDRGKNISHRQVKGWLLNQEVYTLHANARKRFPRNKTMAYRVNEQFQADLCDVSNISKHNDNHNFILVTVDVLSRYACAQPIMNKNPNSVVKGFQKIFSDRKPKILQTDSGTEFTAKTTRKYLKDQGIRFFTSKNETKCAIVERHMRTLKSKLYKAFSHRNSYRYLEILGDVMYSYNNAVHSSIKMRPADVTMFNEYEVFKTLYGNPNDTRKVVKFKFKVGDTVRISETKGRFQKGYLPSYSTELFKVVKCIARDPPVYRIVDLQGETIEGTFYSYELLKFNKRIDDRSIFKIEKILKTRGKGPTKEHLVKWYNWPAKFNFWVKAVDLKKT